MNEEFSYISKDFEEICKKAVTLWGESSQLGMLIEECAELIKAICKYWRDKSKWVEMFDEAVDVELMLGQFKKMFLIDKGSRYGVIRKIKLERLRKRLNEK